MRTDASKMGALAHRIEEQIESQAGQSIAVQVDDGRLVLNGMVESDEARVAALDIARGLAGEVSVEDGLEVEAGPPGVLDDYTDAPPFTATNMAEAREAQIEPDFVSEEAEPVARELTDIAVSSDDLGFNEEQVQFPPTDPVVRTDDEMNAEILGGFSPTSTSAVGVAPSSLDRQPGDEALADAIRRELREDAATTELKIQVEVVEGIAYLRGAVPHMEDLDAVEAVAGEVPGVREVVDELEVQAA
jgi:osmotically-inducible protein OsmY